VLKKLSVVTLFTFLIVVGGAGATAKLFTPQDVLVKLRDNNCVNCHARLSTPLRLTSRYAEWHMSTHKEKAIGCEKCHGGDPKISDEKKAHAGVIAPGDSKSRLHPQNLPETCSACHPGVVDSFVESKHYQKLKVAGLGPSCATCHQHMASQVLYTPDETSAMCSTCHNSPNKLMPPRPEIPQKANEVMQSIRRANTVVVWADRLFEEADNRKLDVSEEKQEQKIVKAVLAEAKISWHAFNLDSVRRKADDAFEMGTKVKDSLRAKLYPQQ
jgi:nitrate/TMAO reductase-like tetraheme cytochrome c subunit